MLDQTDIQAHTYERGQTEWIEERREQKKEKGGEVRGGRKKKHTIHQYGRVTRALFFFFSSLA